MRTDPKATVYRLHRDVQERLIFCVEYYIRQEIRGFQAEAADLDYPAILYDIEPTSDVSAGSTPGSAESMERGWFPTMRTRTRAYLRVRAGSPPKS